jgi:hypothetical protein
MEHDDGALDEGTRRWWMFSRAAATRRGTSRSFATTRCIRSAAGADSMVIRLCTPSVIADA